MDVSELPVVVVNVLPGGDELLKLVWSKDGLSFPSYDIKRSTLVKMAQEARGALEQLVQSAVTQGSTDYARLLQALARAGARLRLALFRSVPDQADGQEIESWLGGLTGRHRVTFVIASPVHIPWGLIYEGVPDTFPVGSIAAACDACEDFWALRYYTSTSYTRLKPIREERSGQSFALIPVVNASVQDTTVTALRASGEDHEFERRALDAMFAAPLKGKQELLDFLPQVAAKDGLLYFLCHASGVNLSFGTAHADQLSHDDFGLDIQRSAPHALLVFFNGCSTVVGDKEGGWLDVVSNTGFCGFIGTETYIPDVFAMRFGLAFLADFLGKGTSILSTMDVLRRRHLPLSLLYSVNCHPAFRIRPPLLAGGIEPATAPGNLSLLKVCTSNDVERSRL